VQEKRDSVSSNWPSVALESISHRYLGVTRIDQTVWQERAVNRSQITSLRESFETIELEHSRSFEALLTLLSTLERVSLQPSDLHNDPSRLEASGTTIFCLLHLRQHCTTWIGMTAKKLSRMIDLSQLRLGGDRN